MHKPLIIVLFGFIFFACSKKKDKPAPGLEVTPYLFIMPVTAGTDVDTFTVTCNTDWTLKFTDNSNTWLQANVAGGKAGQTEVIFSTTQSNYGGTERRGGISIVPDNNSNYSKGIVVTQEGGPAVLSTDKSSLTITGVAPDKDSIKIKGNVQWTISGTASWLSFSQTSGSDSAKVFINNTEDNLTGMDRTATITVTPVGVTGVAVKEITVTQKPWYRVHGGRGTDALFASAKTPDGGMVMAGMTTSTEEGESANTDHFDRWLLKTDAAGKKLWQRSFVGIKQNICNGIAVAADGGYVLAGHVPGQTTAWDYSDISILKTDANGNMQWQRSFGGSSSDVALAIAATNDGGFVITGNTASTDGDFAGNPEKNVFLLKIDAAGNKQWLRWYGGDAVEEANGIIVAPDGGYVIVGWMKPEFDYDGSPKNVAGGLILKTDNNGQVLWQTLIRDEVATWLNGVTLSDDGGFVVAGTRVRMKIIPYNTRDEDAFVAKLNGTGTVIWQQVFGGRNFDKFAAVTAATNGFIATGSTQSPDGDIVGYQGKIDAWTVKVDPAGNKLWQKTIGGTDDDEHTSILPLGNDTYVITGYTDSDKYTNPENVYRRDGLLIKIKD